MVAMNLKFLLVNNMGLSEIFMRRYGYYAMHVFNAGDTVHQTQAFNARRSCLPQWLRHVRGTACRQRRRLSGMHRRRVADDVPSRAEDCTLSVVVWQWPIMIVPHSITVYCCLPATIDCRRFCPFVCFCFVYNFVRCPGNVGCPWHDSVTLISTLLIEINCNNCNNYNSSYKM